MNRLIMLSRRFKITPLSSFAKTRLSTLLWGFSVSWYFTGELVTAVPMFTTMVVGNTILMKLFIND